MKTRKEFDEFIKQLENAIDEALNELDDLEGRQINVDISVNLCPFVLAASQGRQQGRKLPVPVDVFETEKNVHAVIGLPGMEIGNIKLGCDGKSLRIKAASGEKTLDECIELPATVNKTGMEATYKNGILEVVLTKSRKAVKKGNGKSAK